MRLSRILTWASLVMLIGGCKSVVLHPSGDVAVQQRDLLLESTGLMLLIIIPVMALTAFFAWHYRQTNKEARYEPDWDHSTQLELVIWGVPLLIIICLGAMTWVSTHLLDPYRPLERLDANRQVAADTKPLEVEAVALDWKWLFIYPQYGVATVNELAAPVDRPITFKITASSVMNSLFIPALAGQVYAMPGMETQLHAVMNEAGDYRGLSANYSGAGFSGMHFVFHALDNTGFDKWISDAKQAGNALSRERYLELAKPSENVPPTKFADVDSTLYHAVLNRCAEPGTMCINEMSAIDAKGGLGLAGIGQVLPKAFADGTIRATAFGPQGGSVAGLCSNPETAAPARSTPISAPAAVLPSQSLIPLRWPVALPSGRPTNS